MYRKAATWFLTMILALALAGTATAAPSENANPNSGNGGTNGGGNGASVTQYQASYFHTIGGQYDCTGVRIVRDSGRNQFTKDSFSCTITNLGTFPAGTYDGVASTHGWMSDFDGLIAIDLYFVITDNGDGTGTLSGEAYY